MTKYGIVAKFLSPDGGENYTFYDEITYDSLKETMEAINGERGDMIADACSIDCKNEPDLQGFYLDDLEPYEITDLS